MSKSLPSGIDRPEMIGSTKVLNFKDLAGGEKMVYIRVDDQYYRLTLTRTRRLVLTK
ncbi:MAG: hemin uptake protein HemP [Planctomycetota bacterium]|nr:hemin uptake protein HemP [Planctomycetota bacterium]MEC8389509.1 hemin uptake protein HemP [Planctomycetota bacterium]